LLPDTRGGVLERGRQRSDWVFVSFPPTPRPTFCSTIMGTSSVYPRPVEIRPFARVFRPSSLRIATLLRGNHSHKDDLRLIVVKTDVVDKHQNFGPRTFFCSFNFLILDVVRGLIGIFGSRLGIDCWQQLLSRATCPYRPIC